MDVREKLVAAAEVLNYYRNCHYNDSSTTEEYKLAQAINDVLPTLAQVIANGVTVQKWISVKDGLPEKWQNVLVVRTDGAFRLDFIGSLDVWYDDVNFVGYPVTHWMPLPEPPKEDDNNA